MKLRSLAKPHIICHINSGTKASFWHDNWTGLRSLIDIIGPLGPQVSGILIDSSVSEVVTTGAWRQTRSRSPILRRLRQALPSQIPDIDSSEEDYYMWRIATTDPPSVFSTSRLWSSLNPSPPPVTWHKVVWFSQRIPKHSFIVWLLLKGMMLTRDRLRSWGLAVPPDCLLCGHAPETANHLFFQCQYSVAVWNLLLSNLRMAHPSNLQDVVNWLRTSPARSNLKPVLKLVFQGAVYFIWRERNSRLHSAVNKPATQIVKEIQL
ncbi:uncharacterized protein LOC130510134 [Raphanus sativus]|uniref:Uncharacterized protein LOC130510134 n=1 Tax=Raphanus sativus TaxID=3726 RepID=A0A9W3DF80_RAPSA|nr:uncharacterized protein LOC130510134 [Raphanus sativus]